jgi:hypothetical protein
MMMNLNRIIKEELKYKPQTALYYRQMVTVHIPREVQDAESRTFTIEHEDRKTVEAIAKGIAKGLKTYSPTISWMAEITVKV